MKFISHTSERSRGIAVKADDLIAMKKNDGRNFIRPHQVIYIYHNKVDAVGDSASTEAGTFDAVSEAQPTNGSGRWKTCG